MRLVNNTGAGIYVSDIGLMIPIGRFGVVSESIKNLAKSMHLMDLIRAGKVGLEDDGELAAPEIVEIDGTTHYLISGYTVWPGAGLTKPSISSNARGLSDPCKMMTRIREQTMCTRRYVVVKKVEFNVSFDSIRVTLNKQSPAYTLTDEQFKLPEIQGAIRSNFIFVRDILEARSDENGKVVWVSESEAKKKEEKIDIDLSVNPQSPYKDLGLKCFWEGPIFDAGGYANMNRQYIMKLTKLGVSVRPTIMETGEQIEQSMKNAISSLASAPVDPRSPKVYSTNIPRQHAGMSIAYTMMETEQKVHKALVKHMDVANELWVPSEWNRETFFNGGVNKKITVMPLGIDTELYRPRVSPLIFKCGLKRFVFLGISTWLWRKGWDVLIKAYQRAFNADDDVSLMIFTRVPLCAGSHTDKIMADIKDMVGDSDPHYPHLVVVPAILPTDVMPYLYNSVDAFSLFSRGEGWGLPYCEASASGLPVVGADHGGQKMFLNDDNAFLVKPDRTVQCHPSLLSISPFYHDMLFAEYSDVAISKAAEQMRRCYENRAEASVKALKCRENILQNFTWEKAALRVANRLKELKLS